MRLQFCDPPFGFVEHLKHGKSWLKKKHFQSSSYIIHNSNWSCMFRVSVGWNFVLKKETRTKKLPKVGLTKAVYEGVCQVSVWNSDLSSYQSWLCELAWKQLVNMKPPDFRGWRIPSCMRKNTNAAVVCISKNSKRRGIVFILLVYFLYKFI